jgi:nitroreductase
MEIMWERWYPAIATRRSWRHYDGTPLSGEHLTALQKVCDGFRPFPAARAVLVTESPESVFKGALGTYGQVKGAPAFVAFLGQMQHPNVQEMLGYTGEGVVLESTALGLGTCWVGGFFRPEVAGPLAKAGPGERVLAVTPVGYFIKQADFEEKLMAGFGRHSNRQPLEKLVTALPSSRWQAWQMAAVEAARRAPSAVNRQPWRFAVESQAITVSSGGGGIEAGISRRLDCGIAMLNLEVAARQAGIAGQWEFLPDPQVARFRAG